MIQRCFLVSVFQCLQQNRAAALCAEVDITQIGLAHHGNLFVCVQRPARQVSPAPIARNKVSYQYSPSVINLFPEPHSIIDNIGYLVIIIDIIET